jgi:hypothetical protein
MGGAAQDICGAGGQMFDLGVQCCSKLAQRLAQFIGIFRGRELSVEFVDAFVQRHVSLRVSFLS